MSLFLQGQARVCKQFRHKATCGMLAPVFVECRLSAPKVSGPSTNVCKCARDAQHGRARVSVMSGQNLTG